MTKDYYEVKALQEQVYLLHLKGYPQHYVQTDRFFDEDYFKSLLDNKDNFNYVCEIDGKVVGVILASKKMPSSIPFVAKRKVLHIDNIVVDKSCQRKGVGKGLLNFIEEKAIKQKFDSLELNVFDFNKKAIWFYKSQGLEPVSHRFAKTLK